MFRYFTAMLTVCALGGAISVFAQQPAPTESPKPETPALEAATITGCVVEAKTTDGNTVYVLNKAEGGKAEMYVLSGSTPAELAGHVKHKVEVTGKVQEPVLPAAQDEAAKDSKVLRPPMMQIQSVRMVADTCQ